MKNTQKIAPGRLLFQILNYTVLFIAAFACIAPIIHVAAVSLSDSAAAAANRVAFWPVGWNLNAYRYVLERSSFWRAFGVTLRRMALGIPINVIIAVMMAYPLSKTSKQLSGKNIYMALIIFAMLFSGGLIPFMLTMKSLGLMDNIWGLVLPVSVPIFSVLLVMNNIRMLPPSIEEAAIIDGASYMRTLTSVIIPMIVPVIATVTLFSFILHYNSWFDGLVLMNRMENYPLQTFLSLVVKNIDVKSMEETKMYSDINNSTLQSAQLMVTLIPILVIYPFLQEYFTKGMVLGAVKE